MSKELDIQIDVFNQCPDIQLGVVNRLRDIGIDVGNTGLGPNVARIEIRTTAEWSNYLQYIPTAGRIIVYSDKSVINGVPIPGIKIADGLSYVVDLPFVGDDATSEILRSLSEHVNDKTIHITEQERQFWNNKVNYDIDEGLETLILDRN